MYLLITFIVSVFLDFSYVSIYENLGKAKKGRVKTNETVKLFQFLFPGCIIIKHFRFQKLYIPAGLSQTHFYHSNSLKVKVTNWTKGKSFLESTNSAPSICLPVQSKYALGSREFTEVNLTFCNKNLSPLHTFFPQPHLLLCNLTWEETDKNNNNINTTGCFFFCAANIVKWKK